MAMGSSLHPLAASEELDLGAFLYAVQRLPGRHRGRGARGHGPGRRAADRERRSGRVLGGGRGARPPAPVVRQRRPGRSRCCSRAHRTSTTWSRRSSRSRSSGTRSGFACARPAGPAARLAGRPAGGVRAGARRQRRGLGAPARRVGREVRRADATDRRERRLSLRVRMLGGTHTGYARLTRRWWTPVSAELAVEGLHRAPAVLRQLELAQPREHRHRDRPRARGRAGGVRRAARRGRHPAPGADRVPRGPQRGLVGELPVLRRAAVLLRARAPRPAAERRAGEQRERRHPSAQHDRAPGARPGHLAGRARPRAHSIHGSARSTPAALAASGAVIVNIDYPLGVAAYNILREVAVDRTALRGVYILGKAATLNADVGDVMISNVVHDEHSGSHLLARQRVQRRRPRGRPALRHRASTTSGRSRSRARSSRTARTSTSTTARRSPSSRWRPARTATRSTRSPTPTAIRPARPINFSKLPIDLGIIHYASDTPYTQARTLGARGLSYYGMDSTYASSLAILRRILRLEGRAPKRRR